MDPKGKRAATLARHRKILVAMIFKITAYYVVLGIAIAIAKELNLPIQFVGVGEKMDDLLPFDSKNFVDSLFTS